MPYITILPLARQVELPQGSPLTDVEFECFGEDLIPFGCRLGACGACAVEVLTGHDALGQADECEQLFLTGLGYDPVRVRLACQCKLLGNATVRPVDAAEVSTSFSPDEISTAPEMTS
jgi:ferredoxin